MPDSFVGPLRWLSAIIAMALVVWVIVPMAVDAVASSVVFGDPDAPVSAAASAPAATGAAEPASAPAPSAPATQQGQPGGQETYVVEPGDNLSLIAEKVYGDATLFPLIQEANNLDPSQLAVGQRLVVPPPPDPSQ